MGFNATFYKSLPLLHAVIHILEFGCTVYLLRNVYTNPDFFFPMDNSSWSLNTTSETAKIEIVVISGVFLLSEFVPFITVIGLFLLFPLAVCGCCICICSQDPLRGCSCFLGSKPFHRFLSMNCNCPCYRARPQLRFAFRFGFLFICLCLRIAVIIGCFFIVTFKLLEKFGIICGISCIFLIMQLLLDYYQYYTLWHYVPDEDKHSRSTLSKKHKRYLPYHLLGHNRTDNIGNYPCKYDVHCHNRELEHIMIFHSSGFQPQPRWSEVRSFTTGGIYIGFHQTKPEYAIGIAHSDFQPSTKPPQMLGFGIYFARSLKNTFGKARNQGAFICA